MPVVDTAINFQKRPELRTALAIVARYPGAPTREVLRIWQKTKPEITQLQAQLYLQRLQSREYIKGVLFHGLTYWEVTPAGKAALLKSKPVTVHQGGTKATQ